MLYRVFHQERLPELLHHKSIEGRDAERQGAGWTLLYLAEVARLDVGNLALLPCGRQRKVVGVLAHVYCSSPDCLHIGQHQPLVAGR